MPRALRLGINVDHVATVRNARGGSLPDPVRAAIQAVEAGADGITAHLREDRRHITDDDLARLKTALNKPLNLEAAATEDMLEIILRTQPHAACIVPERRAERTTEGGLDVVGGHDRLKPFAAALKRGGVRMSLFIEASRDAVEAAHSIGAPVVEFHTGAWCHLVDAGQTDQASQAFDRIRTAAERAQKLGIECHAGHGLDYKTAQTIAALPTIAELNIGHFLIGEAIFIGLPAAMDRMRAAMNAGSAGR